MKHKRGRPHGSTKDDAKQGVVRFRCSDAEKAKWQEKARSAGKSLSAWIIERLNKH